MKSGALAEKLMVGTASFGQAYGVANSHQLNFEEVRQIVATCVRRGVRSFDTAPDYGSAESFLGACGEVNLNVYSKVPKDCDLAAFPRLEQSVLSSLESLDRTRLSGLSAHSVGSFLNGGSKAAQNFERLKDNNLIDSWGVSVYTPDDLKAVLEAASPDFIQAPASIIDRRFLSPEITALLVQAKTALHVRSVFLQGALLMQPTALPAHLTELSPFLEKLSDFARQKSVPVISVLLLFLANRPEIDKIIVGVNSLDHLMPVLNAFQDAETMDFQDAPFDDSLNHQVMDPRNWK